MFVIFVFFQFPGLTGLGTTLYGIATLDLFLRMPLCVSWALKNSMTRHLDAGLEQCFRPMKVQIVL